MTTIAITIEMEDGDRMVEATATHYDPAIDDSWDEPGQHAYVEYELDGDYEVSNDDDRRICRALIRAIEDGR